MAMDDPRKPMILVADDDITVRMIARESLEQAGFSVLEAENGVDALALYNETKPDAVILDVLMPEMDGLELCRALRALPGTENLPVLMMTALEDVESINAAYEAGANEFTAKPVNWTIEEHRLRNMLRAAAAARQIFLSRQEWERTFNVLDEIVLVQDADLKIIQSNDAATAATGIPKTDLLGKCCHEVLSCAKSPGCSTCPLREVFVLGSKQVFERVEEEQKKTSLVSIFPVFDDAGALSRVVHMVKDITVRQNMEAEVRRAQKMEAVGTLAGGLAHDFNNLLQVISAYSELVSLNFTPDEQGHKDLKQITQAVKRGSGITRQLLAVSRKTESRKESLLLNETVASVAELLRRTLPKVISLELDCAADLWQINADPSQIEQVLMNLAVNANHAMPHGGSLCIRTRNVTLDQEFCQTYANLEPGRYVRLVVTDTGCGMNEETLSRIFEPFFTTRSPDKGTGLGLAMVYGIVQEHGGHLLCTSEEGQGTQFAVYLPEQGKAEIHDSVVQELGYVAAGGTETIMVADDEPQIRSFIERSLAQAGYSVQTAADGQQALDLYRKNVGKFDLAILDQNMPVMDGLELMKALHEINSDLPILVASGCDLSTERKMWTSGRVDYIGKPYQRQQLLSKIRAMLDGSHSQSIKSEDLPALKVAAS